MFDFGVDCRHLTLQLKTAVVEFQLLIMLELVYVFGPERSDAEGAAAADFDPPGEAHSAEDVHAAMDYLRVVRGC